MPAPLRLPRLLQGRIEALADRLLSAPGVPRVDFSAPAGAPSLVAPDSVSWRVFRNPVTLFIGGVAAVLLELGEPRVRHGVWEHSDFRTEPLARLQRTGLAAMVTVYGPADTAREMIAGITRRHAAVKGVTPGGLSYSALDRDLLDWVEATAAFGFLEAYARFAGPVRAADRNLYFSEAAPAADLYGATSAPRSGADWQALLERMRPSLEPSATLREFLAIIRRVPALPRLGRPAQLMLVKAAIDILPPAIAAQLQLGEEWRLRSWERALVAAMAGAANRLVIGRWPAVQACRRLGLPDDYLYR
jgi:uncharacterized protein (DUF2236 family)